MNDNERRRHQCHATDCDSGAVYDVWLHIRYGVDHRAIETMKSTIRCCDAHKRKANDYILSDHNKATITRELAKTGRFNIDWPNAMIEFVPCGEIAWGPQQMVPLQVGHA